MELRFLVLALLFSISGPLATAAPLCASSLCAGAEADAWGEGCGSESGGAYRSVFIAWDEPGARTGAYVSESCWSEGKDGADVTSVAVTRLEWESFEMQGVVLLWETGHSPDGEWCVVTVHAHAPGASPLVPLPCPADQGPPRVLPALV